jgi:hypothetical protein
MVLTVFGDESYDATKSRVFTVSGVLGTDDDWLEAEGEW